ncbi:MAG: nicotinamidase, partial [Verrucomicrobiota bacterium]
MIHLRRLLLCGLLLAQAPGFAGDALVLNLRSRPRPESGKSPARERVQERRVTWDPRKTALIICDMWDD